MADMTAFIGTILMWAGKKAPPGWAFCDGTTLLIEENKALYSLLGATYGGNGTTTFQLPDLRGRVPLGAGTGTHLTPRTPGQQVGQEAASVRAANMQAHTHTLPASSTAAGADSAPPQDWSLGMAEWDSQTKPVTTTPVDMYADATPAGPVQSAPSSSSGIRSPAAIATVSPALGMNFIISLGGIYPSAQ